MLSLIRKQLSKIIRDIDDGNSNISWEEEVKLVNLLKQITDKTNKVSKYQACEYLGVSRATFDNLVRDRKLPRGIKQQGFKELFWIQKDLDDYVNNKKP